MINEKKIALSICIPTYNRGKELDDLFKSILLSIQNYEDIVEIVVSDNGSTDDNDNLVNKYQKKFKHFTYQKWPENVGPDKNFIKVIEISNGEYFWLMGSDDALEKNAIRVMIESINRKQPDMLMTDMYRCDSNLKKFKIHSWLNSDQKGNEYNLYESEEQIRLFNNAKPLWGLFFGYISALALKRSKWNEIKMDDRYIGSFFSFVYPIMTLVNKGILLNHINTPIVLNRGHNDTIIQEFDNENEFKRISLDIKWFEEFSKLLTNEDVRRSYIKLASRNYHLYYIIKLRASSNKLQWRSVKYSLVKFGKSNMLLSLIGATKLLSLVLIYIVKLKNKLKNI
jgi:abequosyltransferase